MSLSRRHWVLAGVAATFAALGGWVAVRRYAPEDGSADALALLMAQSMPDHAGQPFAMSSLRGRVLVLNFWATWCSPCVEEMPELAELHREISPGNGAVVGIGIDSAQNIAEFARKTPYPYPLLVAGVGGIELARGFGNRIGALPFTVLVSAQGQIVGRTMGRIRLTEIRERVRTLL